MYLVYICIKVDYTTCLLLKQLTFVPLPLDCPFIHKIISVDTPDFFGFYRCAPLLGFLREAWNLFKNHPKRFNQMLW